MTWASPLTPLHISGEENSMTDIPPCSFVSNPYWFCKNDTDLQKQFNKNFTLPNQASCTVFGPSNAVSMKIISVLRMKNFEMGEWLHLKKAGQYVGKIGVPLSDLQEWGPDYRIPCISSKFGASQASHRAYAWAAMVEANKSQLSQYLGCSRKLARRSLWHIKETPPRHKATKL